MYLKCSLNLGETCLRNLKSPLFHIKESKINEYVTHCGLNGVLSLMFCDVESPLSWSNKGYRNLPQPLRSKIGLDIHREGKQ